MKLSALSRSARDRLAVALFLAAVAVEAAVDIRFAGLPGRPLMLLSFAGLVGCGVARSAPVRTMLFMAAGVVGVCRAVMLVLHRGDEGVDRAYALCVAGFDTVVGSVVLGIVALLAMGRLTVQGVDDRDDGGDEP